MGYDCVFLQLQEEVFAIATDFGEFLTNKLTDEQTWRDLFDHGGVVGFDVLDSSGFGSEQYIF